MVLLEEAIFCVVVGIFRQEQVGIVSMLTLGHLEYLRTFITMTL
jgi:hypothetical protein